LSGARCGRHRAAAAMDATRAGAEQAAAGAGADRGPRRRCRAGIDDPVGDQCAPGRPAHQRLTVAAAAGGSTTLGPRAGTDAPDVDLGSSRTTVVIELDVLRGRCNSEPAVTVRDPAVLVHP